jgi:probable addiction module antidote protein
MTGKLTRFDAANYLRDEEDIANYLSEIAEDGGPELIASALGDVARSRNMSQLARDAGISRVGLIKALSAEGNPSFATIAKVAAALGLKIVFAPISSGANNG